MNREFLDLYNRELQLLNEQAREFAAEYPGIAERLGGILEDRIDPLIGGLLEGAAFLAARVQLKLKHEFPEFTNSLLEQLVPHYLAPTPSMMLAMVVPTFGDVALREGHAVNRGSYLDAAFRQIDRQISCRYRLCSDITIWPFQLTGAEYFSSPAPLQALGLSVGREVVAGMRLTLSHRSAARPEDEPSDLDALKKPEMLFAGCRTANCRFTSSVRKLIPLRCTSSSLLIAKGSSSAGSTSSAIPSSVRRPRNVFVKSGSNGRMRCFPMISGYSKALICCANFLRFRASFSAAT